MIKRLTCLLFLIVTLVLISPPAQAQVSLQGGNLGWTSSWMASASRGSLRPILLHQLHTALYG